MSPQPKKTRNPGSRSSSFLKLSSEKLGFLVGIVTSVLFILTKLKQIQIENESLLIIVDVLNIIVLLVALYFIRNATLVFEGTEMSSLLRHLSIGNITGVEEVHSRVNELTKQLVHCIRWFVIILGIFYLLQLITDITLSQYETNIQGVLKEEESLVELLAGQHEYKIQAAKYLTIEMFTNATNLFSASYLFLAFQVLFIVTLENDNKTWRLKNYIPISIAVLITLANIILFLVGVSGISLANLSHMIRLTGGIYNGLAMLLLFSRFISMEYFFQNSAKSWQRSFYLYGTVIVLPLYVIAQPMYGVFNAVEIGESAVLFKALVFLVCFWGKLVFLLFIYTMLNKKWMHCYLFMVLSQKDTLSNISKDLKDVEDLQ